MVSEDFVEMTQNNPNEDESKFHARNDIKMVDSVPQTLLSKLSIMEHFNVLEDMVIKKLVEKAITHLLGARNASRLALRSDPKLNDQADNFL